MSYIIGLLGRERVEEIVKMDETECLRETLDAYPTPKELREKLRLWRAVREYLREVPGKSRVGDIHAFLTWLGIANVTRQAIESALNSHGDWFIVTKKGHERYVELKKRPRY